MLNWRTKIKRSLYFAAWDKNMTKKLDIQRFVEGKRDQWKHRKVE